MWGRESGGAAEWADEEGVRASKEQGQHTRQARNGVPEMAGMR